MISLKLSKDYNLLAFSFLCAPAASSSINCILNPPSWVLVLCLQISQGLKGSISPQIPLKHAEYQPRKAPWQNPCLSFTYVVHTYMCVWRCRWWPVSRGWHPHCRQQGHQDQGRLPQFPGEKWRSGPRVASWVRAGSTSPGWWEIIISRNFPKTARSSDE